MQVKNTSKDVPMTITARMNAGAKIESIHPVTGDPIVRDALPLLKTAHIPALATVEIDDAIWNNAWDAKTVQDEYETSFVPLSEHDDFIPPTLDNKPIKGYNERFPTGKQKTRFPLRELVKSGDLVIIEKPDSSLTRVEMAEAIIAANKFVTIPREITDGELQDLYNDVVKY